MDKVRVLCWTSSSGRKPVRDWIAKLDDAGFKKVDRLIGLIGFKQNLGQVRTKSKF